MEHDMNRPLLQVHCLLFAALAMGMHLAHALELAPKLQWGPELYFPVQTSLYRWFGVVGPVLEVLALISVAALAWVSRRDRARFRYVAISLTMLTLGLVVWISVVAPAHHGLSAWLLQHELPANWTALRAQWQFGQAAIFGLHLLGFCALAYAIASGQAQVRSRPGSDVV
jgi:hypothetical protein